MGDVTRRTAAHTARCTADGSRREGRPAVLSRAAANARIQLDELAHIPAFTVPSLGLPVVSYVIFGLPQVHGARAAAAGVFAGFAAFAMLGIVMFQFGVGIAADRASPWERFVRTLPATAAERFLARLLVAFVFGIASLIPLTVCALLVSPLRLDSMTWIRLLVALLGGAVPLGLLGIMLGYAVHERGALPLTNLIYLPLAYAGGLFSAGPGELPRFARAVSPWLPTRQWSDVVVDYGLGGRVPVSAIAGLAGFAALFGLAAVLAYRRDELREYR
jgi:ABC-2 type transport system permease protein